MIAPVELSASSEGESIGRVSLPEGTVTFLFTDIEGSTMLLRALGAEGYGEALAEHRRSLRAAFTAHGGVEIDTQGDAFFVAFATAPAALAAAVGAQAELAGEVRVRMAIHTGTPLVTNEGYVGADVHRAARIAGAGHGGQVLVSSAAASLVDPTRLSDLGEHRLKDLSGPERIYQFGEAAFPPLRSLYQANLPVQPSALVGREREVTELSKLLSAHALVTVTGPGGAGKTRVALQAAAELVEAFEDGTFWVPLGALADPDLVLPTLAQTIGAKGDLAQHIGDKHMLILLDNFEHVLDAAPACRELLAWCPNLRLMATSRTLLRVQGEHEYRLDPLSEQDALKLFRERSLSVDPPDVALEICRRLDLLPLAIELAAARTRLLSPETLLELLAKRLPLLTGGPRDAPARQQTLRATIEWSYDLLSREQQVLFRRLAAFAGSCSLEAGVSVCESDLDTLQSLIEDSLVRRTGERFWMLETIREFAVERLVESGEAEAIKRRHAEHFLGVAEEAALHLDNPLEQRQWLARLDSDLDNLRAALVSSTGGNGTDVGLRLAASLREFWFVRGYYAEGLRWLQSLVEGAAAGGVTPRLQALEAAAGLAMKVDEVALARRYAEAAVALARDAEDSVAVSRSLRVLGNAARLRGDTERQDEYFDEGLALARDAGDLGLVSRFLASSALVAFELGDLDRAKCVVEESLAVGEEAGSEQAVSRALGFMGTIALLEGRWEDAVALERRSLDLAHRLGFMESVAYQLGGLACAYAELGQTERAAKLVGANLRLVEELHLRLERHQREQREHTTAALRTKLEPEFLEPLFAAGRAMSLDEAVQCAMGGDT